VWSYYYEIANIDYTVSKLNVNWYISTTDWGIRNGFRTRVPVRREVIGNTSNFFGENATQFYQILEIFNFIPLYSVDPSIFIMRPEWECDNATSEVYNEHYFIYTTVNITPDNLANNDFINAMTYTLNINNLQLDIIGFQRTVNGTTLVFGHIYVQKTKMLYNALSAIQSKIPTSIGYNQTSFNLTSFQYATTMDCNNNCFNGRCHFGKCICVTGYGGPNCNIAISAVGAAITIEITFANFLPGAFIIGIIWFFIGAGIGFFILKARYKKVKEGPLLNN